MSIQTKEEVWKPIAGYAGLYDVSDRGRVRSYHAKGGRNRATTNKGTHRVLTPVVQPNGHRKITLCSGGAHVDHYVSRLVAAAFLAVPPVYFLDGDTSNLSADNIGYCSRAESMKHTGGTHSGIGKLDPVQVQQIREKYAAGEVCRGRYRRRTVTYVDLAQEYGVGVPTISHIVNRVTHK